MRNNERKLVVLSDKRQIEDLPPSVHYFAAVDPKVVTAITLREGGMSKITFSDPDGNNAVNIYRTIGRFRDGGIGIQDEIHPDHENTGVQFNFEFDPQGRLDKYSRSQEFSELMQRCVNQILKFVTQRGSSIRSGDGYLAISDGRSWIQQSTRQPVTNTQIELAPVFPQQ